MSDEYGVCRDRSACDQREARSEWCFPARRVRAQRGTPRATVLSPRSTRGTCTESCLGRTHRDAHSAGAHARRARVEHHCERAARHATVCAHPRERRRAATTARGVFRSYTTTLRAAFARVHANTSHRACRVAVPCRRARDSPRRCRRARTHAKVAP